MGWRTRPLTDPELADIRWRSRLDSLPPGAQVLVENVTGNPLRSLVIPEEKVVDDAH